MKIAVVFSTFLIFLTSLVDAKVGAKEEGVVFSMRCVTSFPTTSYLVSNSAETLKLEVIHHNGTKYMPIFNGSVTPSDVPALEKRSELLQKLGERITVTFEKANCNKYGEGLYSCGLGKIENSNGLVVERASLLTKQVTEQLFDVVFEKAVISFGVTINDRYYTIENDFYDKTCKFN